jgi:hypothetical protein
MPYRRLPNTDEARKRALDAAVSRSMSVHPTDLPLSQRTLLQAKSFLPLFKQALSLYQLNSKAHKKASKEFSEASRNLRLYISHFIQVLNFAIFRGEFKEEIRKYYGLDTKAVYLPDLSSEENLLIWAKRIIEGEDTRIRSGGTAMSNPRIAMVKIKYDAYINIAHSCKICRQSSEHSHNTVVSLRNQADSLILSIWNETEASFAGLDSENKRKKASEYGISYVFRPSEK